MLLLAQFGCANAPSPDAIKGALTGSLVNEVVNEVQKVFTPEHPLYLNPLELCSVNFKADKVYCTLIPCKENCVNTYETKKWIKNNPYVATLSMSNVSAIKVFCKANKDVCIKYFGSYKGEKILLQK